jgi:hypothetical protein
MPFDGTELGAPAALDTGLFPIWSRHGCRLWFEARSRRGRGKTAAVGLRAPVAPDYPVQTVRLLEDARELIKDPQHWTQGTYRSFRGRRCAVGALRAIARRLSGPNPAWAAHRLLIDIARSRGFASVEAMNDHSSHRDVLSAFDEAIRRAEIAAMAAEEAAA